MPLPKLEATIADAISKGMFNQIHLLVLLDYGVNVKNDRGQTPLMLCALIDDEKWGVKIARNLLTTHRVLLDQQDFRGLTALHYACLFCRQELSEVLLGYSGFNIQCLDLLFNRAMHYAAVSGNPYIVEKLIRHDLHRGISPSGWMTENAAGKTPLTLAKIYRKPASYIILRDLIGEVKYPTKNDAHLTRLLTDQNYEANWMENETRKSGCCALGVRYEAININFMDKYRPSISQRAKLLRASKAARSDSVPFDVSHIDNEADRSKMTKYAMHFSLDLKHWDYLNVSQHQEKIFKVKPVLETSTDDKIGTENLPETSSKSTEKAKSTPLKTNEKEENEIGEEIEGNSEQEENPFVDPKPVCREFTLEEFTFDAKGNSEKVEIEEEGEEKEEENLEDDSFVISKMVYSRPRIQAPAVWALKNKCIKDAAMANFRTPGKTITNVGRKPLAKNQKASSKLIVCVIMELILPKSEKSPYSKKYSRMIKEVFENGLFTREALNECTIPGANPLEYKMYDIYCKEYSKLKVNTVESFPMNHRCPKAMFRKHFFEAKRKKGKTCCSPFPFLPVDLNKYSEVYPKPSDWMKVMLNTSCKNQTTMADTTQKNETKKDTDTTEQKEMDS